MATANFTAPNIPQHVSADLRDAVTQATTAMRGIIQAAKLAYTNEKSFELFVALEFVVDGLLNAEDVAAEAERLALLDGGNQ